MITVGRLNRIRRTAISALESQKSIAPALTSFAAAMTMRHMQEFLFIENRMLPDLTIHYTMFYVCLSVALTLLLHLISRERIETVARVVFPCFLIVNLPPLFDIAYSWRGLVCDSVHFSRKLSRIVPPVSDLLRSDR